MDEDPRAQDRDYETKLFEAIEAGTPCAICNLQLTNAWSTIDSAGHGLSHEKCHYELREADRQRRLSKVLR
jgi:hypothetical protein